MWLALSLLMLIATAVTWYLAVGMTEDPAHLFRANPRSDAIVAGACSVVLDIGGVITIIALGEAAGVIKVLAMGLLLLYAFLLARCVRTMAAWLHPPRPGGSN